MTATVKMRLGACVWAISWLGLWLGQVGAQSPTEKKDAKQAGDAKKIADKVKEIAGTAEYLRDVPKHFATLKAVDAARNQVTLLVEGEVLAKVWPLAPDAEIKITGWWGRLQDLTLGDRVWVWFRTDRKKQPIAISMLADEISEQDIHGESLTVVRTLVPDKVAGAKKAPPVQIELKPAHGKVRILDVPAFDAGRIGEKVYVQSAGKSARLLLTAAELEKRRQKQKEIMRDRWAKDGLPGMVGFVHVFSGEMDLLLDHETMRWARSLKLGDAVTLRAEPPIKALVKHVQPWRERTQVRLVVRSFELAELVSGQRIHLLRPPPPSAVDAATFPPDLDQPRTGKQERIEWFLANIYCTCGVSGDRCTGHFYTLGSCNPNGCGMPNHMRRWLGERLDQGKTDREIMQELLRDQGPNLLKPHMLP